MRSCGLSNGLTTIQKEAESKVPDRCMHSMRLISQKSFTTAIRPAAHATRWISQPSGQLPS